MIIVLGVLFATKIGHEKTLDTRVYSDKEYPLSFSYNTGLNKYAFFVDNHLALVRKSEPNVLRILVLIEESENDKLEEDIKNGVPREGPPALTIFIVNNKEKLTLESWLNKSSISNFSQRIGEVTERVVAQNPALSYRSDGLYTNETVVRREGDYIYVFNVTFNSGEDNIYKDFNNLLNTVQFSSHYE